MVLLLGDIDGNDFRRLLRRFGLELEWVESADGIPGSYWGAPEAGLLGKRLYVREDTPVHSALHEACHFVCMDERRRGALNTDAGGGYGEENGVCYLQILLADHVREMGRGRMFSDMDAWGYSFRLGSARAWFERDADDARAWLAEHGLLDPDGEPAWRLRGEGGSQATGTP